MSPAGNRRCCPAGPARPCRTSGRGWRRAGVGGRRRAGHCRSPWVPSCSVRAACHSRSAASAANAGLRSMPVKRRPRARAARPVVPVPQNGSSTKPPGLQPACMHRVGISRGYAAKEGPRYGRVGIDHTSPGLRPLGCAAATAGAVPATGNDLRGVRTVLGRASASRASAGGTGTIAAVLSGVPPASRRTWRATGAVRRGNGACRAGGGVRHADRVEVEPVVPGSDEQEDQHVPAVHPVADGFGHGVGLVPDDRVADDPPVSLQGEGDLPGQAEQVLDAQARCLPPGQSAAEVGMQPVGAAPPAE